MSKHWNPDEPDETVLKQHSEIERLTQRLAAAEAANNETCHSCGSLSGVYLSVCDDCLTRMNGLQQRVVVAEATNEHLSTMLKSMEDIQEGNVKPIEQVIANFKAVGADAVDVFKFVGHPATCGHCGAEIDASVCPQCLHEEKSISVQLCELQAKLAAANAIIAEHLDHSSDGVLLCTYGGDLYCPKCQEPVRQEYDCCYCDSCPNPDDYGGPPLPLFYSQCSTQANPKGMPVDGTENLAS